MESLLFTDLFFDRECGALDEEKKRRRTWPDT